MAEQDQDSSKQEPLSLEPQPVPAEPEPAPSEPEPVAAKPEPVAAEPEPVAVEPEPVAVEPEPVAAEPEEPISLVDYDETPGESKISTTGADSLLAGQKVHFKRKLNVTGQGATRCRLFHCRIALAPLEHMEHSINEWLDSEEIEIKHVGHIVGTMEGKSPEPNLVVMVWY